MSKQPNRSTSSSTPPRTHPRQWTDLFLLVLLLAGSFLARVPFREVELIRDEGEYAYIGQQILQGAVPYADIYNQKTPFVFYFMAITQELFGSSLSAIRLSTALWGLAATVVIYLLAQTLFGRLAGLWTAAVFSIMTLDECGVVHSANTEFFMLFWIALAVYFWVRRFGNTRPIWPLLAGAAAAMAYQTKQIGAVVLFFLTIDPLWRWLIGANAWSSSWRPSLRTIGLALTGALVLTTAVLGYFAWNGALGAYIECTWMNNWQYVGIRTGNLTSRLVLSDLVRENIKWDIGFWLIGAIALVIAGIRRKPAAGHTLWLILVGFGVAAISAGEYPQYYIPLIVPLSLGCGLGFSWAWIWCTTPGRHMIFRIAGWLLILGPWIGPAIHNGSYLLMSQQQFQHVKQIGTPFDASREVAAYLAEHSLPGECTIIVGSEPQIYYYANRKACTRMVFTYPIVGNYAYANRLEQELLEDVKKHRPRYIAVIKIYKSISEFPFYVDPFLDRFFDAVAEEYGVEVKLPRPQTAGTRAPASLNEYVWILRRLDSIDPTH